MTLGNPILRPMIMATPMSIVVRGMNIYLKTPYLRHFTSFLPFF
ncbi:hypothetical protein Fleli_0142 [Bernardetia litoralis DSM 6794]|uniref:Uncharacterized protein n=1 Tax=Bernardetia litoralis (strain ATCC 23117 / DSM 6794 / NBRC 15988 / NCIMB 1366 / Fx l1 / Sio-4) TaxID=880071 RepID=I4AFA7_BERLS|nr:hypothetical protein Fleli_0142 [Bernardetia litoralis DSM 6794]